MSLAANSGQQSTSRVQAHMERLSFVSVCLSCRHLERVMDRFLGLFLQAEFSLLQQSLSDLERSPSPLFSFH